MRLAGLDIWLGFLLIELEKCLGCVGIEFFWPGLEIWFGYRLVLVGCLAWFNTFC